ncbi:MAG: glycosyltransferase [Rhodoferax sp.]
MLIHFVHAGGAYLPELDAYGQHLRSLGCACQVHRSAATLPAAAEVIWWMCGRVSPAMAARHPQAFQVHEYASASVPPLARAKDWVKRWSQALPQHRIFQNSWVRQRLGFADQVPFDYRDMGLAPQFLTASHAPRQAPEFDFVYVGEMARLRQFRPALEAIAECGKTLLLVGQLPPGDDRLLRHFTCTGRVPHAAVAAQLRRARVGLNLVPNRLPFAEQTSTKLLEYCAVGLPVASTDYAWARRFAQQHGARFVWLPGGSNARAWHAALARPFAATEFTVPDLHQLSWQQQMQRLSVWQTLGLQA